MQDDVTGCSTFTANKPKYLATKNFIKEVILKLQLIFPMQFANCESNSFFISTLKKLFNHMQSVKSRAREQIQNRDLTFN